VLYHRAVSLLVEAIIGAGALVVALLSTYLVITVGLFGLTLAWPGVLTRAAQILLWPVARLSGVATAEAGPGIIGGAIALYLLLTAAAVAAVNLIIRPPRNA
jgi:hypothetical protein